MKKIIFALIAIGFACSMQAQGILGGKVSGNFQIDMQLSREDSII